MQSLALLVTIIVLFAGSLSVCSGVIVGLLLSDYPLVAALLTVVSIGLPWFLFPYGLSVASNLVFLMGLGIVSLLQHAL